MSYHVYAIDGYGICDAYNACEVTKERVESLLALAPNASGQFHEAFGTDYEIEDLDDYESEYAQHGVLALLCDVMNEAEYAEDVSDGVEFVSCEDFDSRKYVMYVPTYPWRMSDREKRMTSPEVICELFAKYTQILFGEPAIVNYYTCENGG